MEQTLTYGRKGLVMQIVPVMLCFFAMGFVDLVGTASNYVQKDLGLTDSQANLFPSLVFFWFLIFSVPTGMLMNRIGRKKTVLISLVVTAVSLIIPVAGDSYLTMLAAFSLLGIGNAIMQTSLNPLVTNLISGDKLASTLTFGQFVKAIASFLAPILAAWGATTYLPTFGLGWRVLFATYAIISVLSISLLAATPIEGGASRQSLGRRPVSPSAGPPLHPALLPRHHVSRRHRCRHQHDRSQNYYGTPRPPPLRKPASPQASTSYSAPPDVFSVHSSSAPSHHAFSSALAY